MPSPLPASLPSCPAAAGPGLRRSPRERTLGECSRCAVRTLLALGLGGRDAGGLLSRIGEAGSATGLRDSALLDRLVEAVRRDPRAAGRVRDLLEGRLGPRAERYRGCSLAELARLWSQDRHRWNGEDLLVLLWVVISRDEPACRSFEERLVEEISVLALQSLAAAPAVCPATAPPSADRGRAAGACSDATTPRALATDARRDATTTRGLAARPVDEPTSGRSAAEGDDS